MGADAVGVVGGPTTRYEIVGVLDFNFERTPNLELDARRVDGRSSAEARGS
jgi:hypothetical protein